MNENLDLVKILKNCPRGMKLYSPFCGEVELDNVGEHCIDYPIVVNHNGNPLVFTCDGRLYNDFPDGECVLFPSKDQRDWSKFKMPVKKFNHNNIFDKSFKFPTRCILGDIESLRDIFDRHEAMIRKEINERIEELNKRILEL